MTILSHHLETVVRAARLAGAVQLAAFLIYSTILAAVVLDPNRAGPFNGTWNHGWLAGFLVAAYLVPGCLLWIMGGLLGDGRMWAFGCIVGLALFDVLKLFFMGFICFEGALRLPTLLLAATCLNAFSDVRDHYRQRRRDKQRRGFQPVMSAAPPAAKPPPPAGGGPLKNRRR